ncbi:MAG TPA: cytochrome c oxidase assembly protein [Micromonosporaceae bacterium]|nr:cytochrome c oxidase assembly protein [Micromonosporaceae bacterium]
MKTGTVGGRRWPQVLAGLAVALGVMAAMLRYGGAARYEPLPGLPDAGAVTVWALPIARLGVQVFAVTTIGLLLAAVVLSPRQEGGLSAVGYRRLRAAGWTALGWFVSAVATLCYTLSDLIGAPMPEAVSVASMSNFILSVNLGQSFALASGLAFVVFWICRLSLRPTGATVALVLALIAVVPPVFTGHAASASDHQIAVSGMLLHVIPVTLWVGGLFALVVTGRAQPGHLAVAVRRFSPLATACLAAVTFSGVISAFVRLPTAADFIGTRYGHITLIKIGLLVAIGAAGLLQRRSAMPALQRGERRVFARVAVVEVLLFAAAVGAAVALSRTEAPRGKTEGEDLATAMLGFPMPPPFTVDGMFLGWLPDPLLLAVPLVAAGCYLAGVWRLRRRGDSWPAARSAAFLVGCLVVVIAASSGLARYGPVLFSVHMVQHLFLMMVAPILIVLAAPVTLALRALPKAKDPAWPGLREWLQGLLHSRYAMLLTQPIVALTLYVGSMFVMYFTGLFEIALRSHAAHLAMVLHFFAAGYLFFWLVIGVDPGGRPKLSAPLRIMLVLISMVLHAILGLVIMQSSELLAADWFNTLPRDWGPTPLEDQHTAGGIAWSFGEIPTVVVIIILVRQWIQADEREQRRLDRAAARAEAGGPDDAHVAYNRMLARLAQGAPGGVPGAEMLPATAETPPATEKSPAPESETPAPPSAG